MKSLFHYLIPDLICDSVRQIPFEAFEKQGVRLVIFDIDNTLVSYETPIPDDALREFLLSFEKRGVRVALVSNNSPERVEIFNRSLGFFVVSDAHKPLKRALKPVFEHFSIPSDQVLLVGDQLLTDVFAARLFGIRAVLVSPIQPKENSFFRFKRFLEKPFIWAYYRKKTGEEENV